VLERDGMVCHVCAGSIADLSDLHFDHVIPLARGGAHHADNIKPAHALCNLRKSDKIA
jgi:5-methylcytosine-specific restriction endonuclease McrA